jgi:rubrerythrin
MDIGSIFLLLALMVLVVFFVGQPFFNRWSVSVRQTGATRQQISTLQAEHDRVLQALQELDFDHSLGKVPEEDYPVQRNALLLRGVDVLKKLDALQPQAPAKVTGDKLEEALAARRKVLSQASAETRTREQNEELEALIAARRRARNGSAPREKSVGFCPQCGKSIQKSDRFCPKCGTELR